MLSKLSYLNSSIALTLGYLNPALNNSALVSVHHNYDRKTNVIPKNNIVIAWVKV